METFFTNLNVETTYFSDQDAVTIANEKNSFVLCINP